MKSTFNWLFSLALGLAFTLTAAEPTTPKAGSKAPLFEGKDQDGKTWKLADYAGKKHVLLYFYPKDETPGCTAQACALRDQMGDLKKGDVEVVGVSFDNSASHKKFQEKHNLNFTLLADTDGKIADAFGARRGPGANMPRRVSFLIAKDGTIRHVTDAPKPDVHLSEMKAQVEKL